MSVQIMVPALGESVSEATVLKWFKTVGEAVEVDEPLLELETDKVTVEVPAPSAGILTDIAAADGAEVAVGALLGSLDESASATPATQAVASAALLPEPAAVAVSDGKLSPAVRKLIDDNKLNPAAILASGKKGQPTKSDVEAFIAKDGTTGPTVSKLAPARPMPATSAASIIPATELPPRAEDPREEIIKMSRLRQRIAQRLKEAQNTAAILTTYNEVDMTEVMALRSEYKDLFLKKHGVKLGFMSFFTKACVHALNEVPEVNAEIDGTDVVYKNFVHMGIAAGTPTGLVVPVIRDADAMGFAEIEKAIGFMGAKARDGKLSMADMQGGTFTISNLGMMDIEHFTAIINPPEAAILAVGGINQVPVVIDGGFEVGHRMKVTMTCDHRVIDGAVGASFLQTLRKYVESPWLLLA